MLANVVSDLREFVGKQHSKEAYCGNPDEIVDINYRLDGIFLVSRGGEEETSLSFTGRVVPYAASKPVSSGIAAWLGLSDNVGIDVFDSTKAFVEKLLGETTYKYDFGGLRHIKILLNGSPEEEVMSEIQAVRELLGDPREEKYYL